MVNAEDSTDPESPLAEKPLTRFQIRYRRNREKKIAAVVTSAKKRRAADPEGVRAKDRAYYAKTRARRHKLLKASRKKNPAPHRASSRKWKQEHLEQARATNRVASARKRKLHPEYHPAWVEQHPDQIRQNGRLGSARRRAKKQQLQSNWTKQDEAFARHYWHHACAVCGNEEGFYYTIAMDHWVPIHYQARCPGTIPTNMIPLCHKTDTMLPEETGCNSSKGRKDPLEWLIERLGKRKAQTKLKQIQKYFASVRQIPCNGLE
jgi:hypothetical protein